MVSMCQWAWAQPRQLGVSGLQPKSIQVAGTTQFHMAVNTGPRLAVSLGPPLAPCPFFLFQAATAGGVLSSVNPLSSSPGEPSSYFRVPSLTKFFLSLTLR